MDKVRLFYMRQRRLDSWFLRQVMWSPWSHEGVLLPGEQKAIHTTFFGRGVHLDSIVTLQRAASHFEVREFEVPDAARGYQWLGTQVGKPYDTWGVLGIGLHREWAADDKWFCSELAEAFLEECGLHRFVDGAVRRVTPQHSWMVA